MKPTREILTRVEIDAPPTVVWDVLTDLSSYHEWNPHVSTLAVTSEKAAKSKSASSRPTA